MGLEGTLRVFSLNDIFQVLGLQRKSGILTVEGAEDTVTISFLGGQVVMAESAARRMDNRIGSLLVRAGRIDEQQLARVVALQKETQQRLGFLLIRERLVTPEDLREALRLQIFRVVFACFRWIDGRFRFTQEGSIDYDADHMSPVPAESILMEAAQMMDEWPLLEKKIRSPQVVFARAPGVEKLRLLHGGEETGEGILAVSRPEAEVWRWVDGKRDVADILERAFLSDFDVYKGLADLLHRNLIGEASAIPEASVMTPARSRPSRVVGAGIVLWAAFPLFLLLAYWLGPRNPLSAWKLGSRSLEAPSVVKAVSLERLVVLERAVRVFYDSSGQYPRGLEDLVAAGILAPRFLIDPYGRTYRYILRSEDGKFGLYGRNSEGSIDLDLSFDRTLAPVAEIRPGSLQPKPAERRPGVQVIE